MDVFIDNFTRVFEEKKTKKLMSFYINYLHNLLERCKENNIEVDTIDELELINKEDILYELKKK